jgi:hypothetical protein
MPCAGSLFRETAAEKLLFSGRQWGGFRTKPLHDLDYAAATEQATLSHCTKL